MKTTTASVIALLMISALACTQQSDNVTPTSAFSGARGGSPSPSPTPPTSTTLPALPANPNPINDLGPIMPTSTWTVKSYYRGGSEATSDFSGCTFVFNANGLVTATDSKGKSTTGGWYATIGGQVIYYGAGPSITSLTLNFDKKAPRPFDRLTSTWNVNLATTSRDVVVDNFEPLAGERIEFSY